MKFIPHMMFPLYNRGAIKLFVEGGKKRRKENETSLSK